MRARHVLLAIAAGLALADASVVTLALPELLDQLNTSVEGVAAVLGVYTVALAATLLPVERVQRRFGPARTGAAGLAVFGLASMAAGACNALAPLLVARGVQAAGGAAALVAVFSLLEPSGASGAAGRRLWLGAAVLAGACGPALGGALTEAFSWRAIFYVQAPVALLAALVCLREPEPAHAASGARPQTQEASGTRRFASGPAVALALLSAALTAVLFLLVLLLVAGWDVPPLEAAAAVTAIPAAALVGSRLPGPPVTRAAAGCTLVGAGVLALAFLPGSTVWWTIPAQVAAGLGMGLALPALGGDLLPERTPRDAARLLTLRHAGIALALAILAPVVSNNLDSSTERARVRGVAVVLDAKLQPLDKIRLAPALLDSVQSDQPRAGLRSALEAGRGTIPAGDRAGYDALARGADDTLVTAVGEAFRVAFLITGALALLAAIALVPRRLTAGLTAAAATAVVLPAGYIALHASAAPEPVAIRDPCQKRDLPQLGGVQGFLQDQALRLLDTTACKLGSSREELVLALADNEERRRFQERYGVDPRSAAGILGRLFAAQG